MASGNPSALPAESERFHRHDDGKGEATKDFDLGQRYASEDRPRASWCGMILFGQHRIKRLCGLAENPALIGRFGE
jgi:hypothetical protein